MILVQGHRQDTHVVDDVIYQAVIAIDSKAFSFRWDFSVIVFRDMNDDDLAMGSLEAGIDFLCLEHGKYRIHSVKNIPLQGNRLLPNHLKSMLPSDLNRRFPGLRQALAHKYYLG